ncbi:serine--tRNA ligase [Membranihabitans marinus]|uniref:serine--tRNA ligase n=1 Tax=Membranihabitans marinus TaxID=1227546 RepID=UPI001F02B032|nr:serine--tRNA ligase [Membranihabitans marinus]
MLEVNNIRKNKDIAVAGLQKRGIVNAEEILDEIIRLDDERKNTQTQSDKILNELKTASKEIGDLYKSGKAAEANAKKAMVGDLKQESTVLEDKLKSVVIQLEEKLLEVPNVPNEIVPAGKTEDDNIIEQDWTSELPHLPESALPHWDILTKYDIVDFDLGVKIAGSGFPLYKGKGAKLQRALIQFFLDEAIAAGCLEILPPHLVNEDTARGTGQLPDKEGQMYHVTKDNLYLIPTAEVPVTNIFRNEILQEDALPYKLTAYTPCFRREAGSYGSDVKGLNRVHQFDKVEMVVVSKPENSYEILDEMVDHVKQLLEKLNLPYRILRLCAGDLGFTSAITYDFEVYSAAQKKWLEVSSVSNFETFQSNRMKIRYKNTDGKSELVHTLNGSVLALARIFAAILENNQTENSVEIPEILKPYTGFERIN